MKKIFEDEKCTRVSDDTGLRQATIALLNTKTNDRTPARFVNMYHETILGRSPVVSGALDQCTFSRCGHPEKRVQRVHEKYSTVHSGWLTCV